MYELYLRNHTTDVEEEFSRFPHLVSSLSSSKGEQILGLGFVLEHPAEHLESTFSGIAWMVVQAIHTSMSHPSDVTKIYERTTIFDYLLQAYHSRHSSPLGRIPKYYAFVCLVLIF